MGKYFGTDGFRGEANVGLTADHAYKVGRFIGWYYTQLKRRDGSATGNVGYMMTKYLTLNGTASTIKTIQNGSTYVNFRSAPSVSASTVYARLYTGTPITVLTPGDQWTQIRYNGQTGYVMTQFLK